MHKKIVKKVTERIIAFDLLRGYFLVVILFNHLWYYPSGLELFTGRSMLYVSSAEGFFVVSGIMLGIVRGRKLLNQPFKVAAKLLWKRSFQLYLTSIILTFFFTLIGQLFLDNPGLKFGIYTDWSNGWNLVWQTITLSYTYGWADFLRLYAIFIFFAPFALWLLRKGYWYILAAISIILWSSYPFLPQDPIISQPFSWQLIFFAGLTIGFYWHSIVEKWRTLSIRLRKSIGWSLVVLFVLTLITTAVLVFGHMIGGVTGASINSVHNVVGQHFNKDQLGPARLLLGAVWFWALFYLFRRYEGKIIKYFGWLFINFGSNSLYVYTVSAFVVFTAHLIIAPPGLNNILLNLLISLAALGVVLLCVKTKFLMKIIPR